MGKISPVAAKYIIHAAIEIDGVVDKPDVIGAIFGQTEGLLGTELELRELQRSGRIGRIEVDVEVRSGKTKGFIIIPSSLDKAETCIVGAALEIIQRIGPCNAKIKVEKLEDVRISKRQFIIDRAKELLRSFMDMSMPDSQELADEVTFSVRVMEVCEYGRERIPAGPAVDESPEIIVVEGRADVLNLLKHGIKNAIAINGTSVPQTIIDLSKQKTVTVFVDGDRGGDLIIRELLEVAEIDYVTKAPDGKEVEEITQKEIHKALRSRVAVEQVKMEMPQKTAGGEEKMAKMTNMSAQGPRPPMPSQNRNFERPQPQQTSAPSARPRLSPADKKTFKDMLEDLIGTRGAYILDAKMNILGKVPVTELASTVKSLGSVHAIVLDEAVDKDLIATAEKSNVAYIIAMENKSRVPSRVTVLTTADLA